MRDRASLHINARKCPDPYAPPAAGAIADSALVPPSPPSIKWWLIPAARSGFRIDS
jgi:hypothetical protein